MSDESAAMAAVRERAREELAGRLADLGERLRLTGAALTVTDALSEPHTDPHVLPNAADPCGLDGVRSRPMSDDDRDLELMRSAYRIGYADGYKDHAYGTEAGMNTLDHKTDEFIERVREMRSEWTDE